eukprot:459040-Pleurochrysis_carterae.AAC.7
MLGFFRCACIVRDPTVTYSNRIRSSSAVSAAPAEQKELYLVGPRAVRGRHVDALAGLQRERRVVVLQPPQQLGAVGVAVWARRVVGEQYERAARFRQRAQQRRDRGGRVALIEDVGADDDVVRLQRRRRRRPVEQQRSDHGEELDQAELRRAVAARELASAPASAPTWACGWRWAIRFG